MTENEAVQLFKCLADATRLQILKALQDGPKYVELLGQRLERTPSTVSYHLKKLEEAKLVHSCKEQYYTVYSLLPDALSPRICDIIGGSSDGQGEQEARELLYRQKVLEHLFEYGKLKTIPVQRKKRRIVLEKISESFEPDRVYPEKEVNLIIAQFHDDFCTLRREMISEEIMDRNREGYWLKTDGEARECDC